MTDVILYAIIVATFAKGMWYTFGDGEVFSFWGKFIQRLPAWMKAPLGYCPRCMCSAFGIIAIAWLVFIPAPYVWIIALPCAIGIQEMIDR